MDGILAGLNWLATEQYWLAFFAAVAMAAVAGLMPGISAGLLMALAVPFIVFTVHDPVIGIVMLATITGVEEMLDVLPIVVLGHPGGGQVTFIEARPLVSKGQAAHVLGFICMVSALGGLIGAVALLLVIPIIKPFILQFSFAEIGAVGLFGVAIVGALSRGAMIKGIASGAFGLLLSTIGISVFTGEARYTFDPLELREGLPLIATAIGLFALPEMFDLMMTRKAMSTGRANLSTREVFRGAGAALRYWRLIIRHSLLGVFLGAIPGVGSRVVSWLSYGIGVSLSKNKEQFGKGSYEGLIFSESVQSAKEGGQAIPTLALGVAGRPELGLCPGGDDLLWGISRPPNLDQARRYRDPDRGQSGDGQCVAGHGGVTVVGPACQAHPGSLSAAGGRYHTSDVPCRIPGHPPLDGDPHRFRVRGPGPLDEAVQMAPAAVDPGLHLREHHRGESSLGAVALRCLWCAPTSLDHRPRGAGGGHWCLLRQDRRHTRSGIYCTGCGYRAGEWRAQGAAANRGAPMALVLAESVPAIFHPGGGFLRMGSHGLPTEGGVLPAFPWGCRHRSGHSADSQERLGR